MDDALFVLEPLLVKCHFKRSRKEASSFLIYSHFLAAKRTDGRNQEIRKCRGGRNHFATHVKRAI